MNALTSSRNVRTASQIQKDRAADAKTSQSAYAAEIGKSLDLLEQLEVLVLEKDCIGRNWAEVGSLAHANELIQRAVNHLAGRDE